MLDASIIIVSYNTARLTLECLQSVETSDCEKEIFVVDNASIDQSVTEISAQFPSVKLLANKNNRGFGAANNQALKECRARYIIFLNPDTTIKPDTLRNAVTFMDVNQHIGLAGAKILNPDGTLQESVSDKYPSEKLTSGETTGLKGNIACVLGAFMIARKPLLDELHGFDEDFFLYGEDQDLAWRIREKGFSIGYIEDAEVYHRGGQSEIGTSPVDLFNKKIKAEYLFYAKHYKPITITRIKKAQEFKALYRLATLKMLLPFAINKENLQNKIACYKIALDMAQSKENFSIIKQSARQSSIKTSVIICFYEKSDYLKCCLDTLKNCTDDFDEVVISDDGSNKIVVNEVKKYVEDYPFPIVYAWHQRKGARRAACRNNGIRHASGDYLIFLDADFAVLPDAIKSHVDAAKPGWFAAGRCKYTTEEQIKCMLSERLSAEFLEKIYAELSDAPISKEHREFIRYGVLRKLRLASVRKQTFGGHFSIFKKDIESVNGYDENYIGWGGEDQDIAMRLVMAGFRGTSVIKSARILHLWHPKDMGDKHWREGKNIEYFFREKINIYCDNGLIKNKKKSEPEDSTKDESF